MKIRPKNGTVADTFGHHLFQFSISYFILSLNAINFEHELRDCLPLIYKNLIDSNEID